MAVFGSEMSQSDMDVRANGVDKSLGGVLHLPPAQQRSPLSVVPGDCAAQNAISQVNTQPVYVCVYIW